MKNFNAHLSFILLMLLIPGCHDSENNNIIHSTNHDEFVFVKSYPIGMWPNALYKDGHLLYIVDSGNNEIDIYHTDSDSYEDSVIKLPVDSNPVQVSVDDENVYIIASKSNILYQFNKSSKSISKILDHGLSMPYSIITANHCHTIVNSEYNFEANTAEGSITQICNNRVQNIKTPCQNSVSIQALNDQYLLTCSGVYQYDASYQITGTDGSSLVLLDNSYQKIKSVLDNDDPGTVAFSDNFIISGSAFKGTLHLFDRNLNILDTYQFNSDDTNIMLIPRHLSDNMFVVADFNHDKLFLIDTQNGKIEFLFEKAISDSPVARKGPLDMIFDDETLSLYILNSISESLEIYQF